MLLTGKGFSGHTAKSSVQLCKEVTALRDREKELKISYQKRNPIITHTLGISMFLSFTHEIVFRIGIFHCFKNTKSNYFLSYRSQESWDEGFFSLLITSGTRGCLSGSPLLYSLGKNLVNCEQFPGQEKKRHKKWKLSTVLHVNECYQDTQVN